ncbi:MAG: hypothetical protein ACJ8GJ_14270 [Vitreoscilla sp.]
MKINMILRAAILTAALSAVTGIAVARSTTMIELGRQTAVTTDSRPLSVEAMRKAIIAGGSVHGWKPVGDQPGVLTLEADSGSHQAVVDVAYDAQGWQINYKNSANLNYERTDRKTSIHPKYNKWVEELNSEIRRAATSIQPASK